MITRRTLFLSTASLLAAATMTTIGNAHEIKFGNLLIEHPWSRQPASESEVAAGFMKITNTGTEDDRLVGATAEITPTVQLHDMKMEGDVMRMVELPEGIVIPAGKTVALKPKSLHIMFIGLKSQPVEGASFKGTLIFNKAGTVEVEFEAVAAKSDM